MAIIKLLLLLLVLLGPAVARADDDEGGEEETDPPEVVIGERLFLETRFAQFFQAHAAGDMNAVLTQGDPVMNTLDTMAGPIPGPFPGAGMNCRQCHLVDDAKDTTGGGNRSYADFARHSPIPTREDGRTMTRAGQLRNGARELSGMRIGESDVASLAAFLRALNEDYE